jgi:two-component system, response regulator YesN
MMPRLPSLASVWKLQPVLFRTLAASLCAMALLSVFGTITLRSKADESSRNLEMARLEQSSRVVEGILEEIRNLSTVLARTSWVERIASMYGDSLASGRVAPYDVGQYVRQLTSMQKLDGRIDRIMVAFPEKRTILHENGMCDYEDFFSRYYRTPSMETADWSSLLSTYAPSRLIASMPVSDYGRENDLLTYIVPIPLALSTHSTRTDPNALSMPKAVLIVSLKTQVIAATIQNLIGDSTYEFQAYQGRSPVLSCTSSGERPANGSGVEPNGDETIQGDDIDRSRFTTGSVEDGLQYVLSVPSEEATAAGRRATRQGVAIFFGTLLAYLVAAGFSVRNVIRADEAMPEVDWASSPDPACRDVDTVGLRNRLDSCLPLAAHSFFNRLLNDADNRLDLVAMKRHLGIEPMGSEWTVAVLQSGGDERAHDEPQAYTWTIEGAVVQIVEIDRKRDALIINTDDSTGLDPVLEYAKEHHPFFQEAGYIVGVGGRYRYLGEIHRSFREALSAIALHSGGEDGGDSIHIYDASLQEANQNVAISPGMGIELLRRVKSGEFEKVKGFLYPLIDQKLNRSGYSPTALQMVFLSLLDLARTQGVQQDLPPSVWLDEQRLLSMRTVQDMKDYLGDIFMQICETVHVERRGHLQRMRDEILEYIDRNCLDDKLSLQSLADTFEVSTPYLSRFIKEQIGVNFLDYVTRKRILKAKEMLRSGEYSIQEIGARVGYENPLTFRRAFRRIEGVNPGDFKELPLEA